jgi:8-oxo-dGTP pyrophosphatase MutT (NUDIX family)
VSNYALPSIEARLALHRASSTAGAPAGGREAAVAIVLRPGPRAGDDAELLLIRRAEHPDDPWSGHMAFPGGRRDEEDASLEATAVREAAEEVGVDLAAHGRRVARLDDVPAIARGKRTGLTIAPFVFAYGAEAAYAPLAPKVDEVAEALWVPVGPLARGDGAGTHVWSEHGRTLELPCLHVGDRVVWGLTYMMLQTLFDALRGG